MGIILFGQDEEIIQSNQGVSKSFDINQPESNINYEEFFKSFSISTNQNRAVIIWKILCVLISTNQNRAFFHSKFCVINQSERSIHRFQNILKIRTKLCS